MLSDCFCAVGKCSNLLISAHTSLAMYIRISWTLIQETMNILKLSVLTLSLWLSSCHAEILLRSFIVCWLTADQNQDTI